MAPSKRTGSIDPPTTAAPTGTAGRLIRPHGGELIDLMAGGARAAELAAASRDFPSSDLTPRQICDLELLMNGGFSPLRGFLGRADYEAVLDRMRLADGTLWPIPVILDLPAGAADRLAPGASLALRDPEGVMLAVLHVEEIWEIDPLAEAEAVYGTDDPSHPGCAYLFERQERFAVGGPIEGIRPPSHHDFSDLRLSPSATRRAFAEDGWTRALAFQTRNTLHRAHYELTRRACERAGARLLIHPVVGMTKPGDLDHYTRVRTYQAILPYYPEGSARLALLPLAMRMAGPREAVWHAVIRRNFGCSHILVGRDHAGPGRDAGGTPFYGPYDAQALCARHAGELGIAIVPMREMVYVEERGGVAEGRGGFVEETDVPPGATVRALSGTELRRIVQDGGEIPAWFTFPEVAAELRRRHPPRAERGFTIFFTGLSGAGKSTVGRVLVEKLLAAGDRPVTFLDGDVVRRNLSSELGFSKEHRDLNIRRIGFVASEITKNGGIAVCAPIAPYDAVRKEVREMVSEGGRFVLVHLDAPLAVCEARDRKGLYAKARAGLVPNFTGVSDPYEPPEDAEVVIDTSRCSPEDAAEEILSFLAAEGYVAGRPPRP